MATVEFHVSAEATPTAYELSLWLAQHPVRTPFIADDAGRVDLVESGGESE